MPYKSSKQQSLNLLQSLENNIFIIAMLIKSFQYKDYNMKKNIIKFATEYLTDKEISNIYKSCSKYLSRIDYEEEEFIEFLKTTEE